MKLDNKEPIISRGWLVSGERVGYGNTPLIQVSLISGFTYYEDNPEDGADLWHIKFTNELTWKYNSREECMADYLTICLLLLKGDEEKKYI